MSIYRFPSRRVGFRLVVVVLILLVWLALRFGWWRSDWPQQGNQIDPSAPTAVEQAWKDQQSDVWVEADGQVERLLSDDLKGSRHQRFVIRTASGLTLLISHNIDLARRVPIEIDDRVRVRGQYEWNKKGGVIHWTHHDPQGKLAGGWISLHNKDYR